MGARLSINENEPHKTGGSYVARSLHGLPGLIMFLWLVAKVIMLILIRLQLWTGLHPLTPIFMCIPTLIVGLLGILFNIFYFGPHAKKTPRVTNATETHVMSQQGLADRLSRVGNDQWLYTVITAFTAFMLLFMTVYYDRFGEFPWRPQVASPSGTQITQRGTVASLIDFLIAICGLGVLIVLCTITDTVKRLHMNMGGELEGGDVSGDYQLQDINTGSSTGTMTHSTNHFQ